MRPLQADVRAMFAHNRFLDAIPGDRAAQHFPTDGHCGHVFYAVAQLQSVGSSAVSGASFDGFSRADGCKLRVGMFGLVLSLRCKIIKTISHVKGNDGLYTTSRSYRSAASGQVCWQTTAVFIVQRHSSNLCARIDSERFLHFAQWRLVI